jgi:4-hydroxybenzoate polyprenyltransferase
MKISPYYNLLRIKDAKGYFLITILGFFLAKGYLFPLRDIFFFFLIIFFLSGFGFSINDCFDQKEDSFDKTKKNPLVSKEIEFKKALTFSLSLAILGLIFSSFYGLTIFLFSLCQILSLFLYSSPLFRLKSKPFLDLIVHGFFGGFFLLFFPLLFFKVKLSFPLYLMGASFFYFSIILELRNEYEDYEAERMAQIRTTAQLLGKKNSQRLIKYLTIFYPLFLSPLFFLNFSQLILHFFILTCIFFIFLFKNDYQFVKNYKILDAYVFFSFALILLSFLSQK